MVQSQYGQHSLEGARAAEQVAGHGLGCGDGNVLGVLTEGFVHCGCFGQVTGGGAGGVRVDVHDGLRVDVAVFEGFAQCAGCAECCGVRCGDVVGVGGYAGACQFRVDACAACLGVLFGFEDERCCAFTHDEAVAVDVVGAGCLFGFVVAGGECLHLGECCHGKRVDCCFSTADDDDVCLATADHFSTELHGFGGGCACGDDGLCCGAGLEVHGDGCCVAVGHEHRNGHGEDAAGALFAEGVPCVEEGPHATDAGAEGYAGAFGVDFFCGVGVGAGESCVFPCFACGDEGELARGIQALCFYLGEAAGFEGGHGELACNVYGQVVFLDPGVVEGGYTRYALGCVFPGGGDVAANGGGRAEAGHQHFSRHCGTFSSVVDLVVYPVVCG